MTYTSLSLGGSWEMDYTRDEYTSLDVPIFKGFEVENAVPGYWEDMTDKFLSAPFYSNLMINPAFGNQRYPISATAPDMALPNYMGNFFYRRKFCLDVIQGDCFIHFVGVQNKVSVWINNTYIGSHIGYSVPFDIKIPTEILLPEKNEIVLSVSNLPIMGYNGKIVSGLTNRAACEYTGGIIGDIELRMSRSTLRDANILVSDDCSKAEVIVDNFHKSEFRWELSFDGDIISSGKASGNFEISIENLERWTPENPVLYCLKLICSDGSIERSFGVRKLVAKGNKLFLNGAPYFLRGVCEHCYYPETLHPTSDIEYYRSIIKKFKTFGFNFIRFHTYVPRDEYLQAADELGMLVHIESPNNTTLSEWEEIVSFCRKHSCVVIYCCGNELLINENYLEHLKKCADIVHKNTDALFSPQSALRGIEYCVFDEKDKSKVSTKPFIHHKERFEAISEFSDIYSSYANELLSYDSLDADPAFIDSWADIYKKPRVSHEICIDGTYTDLSLKNRYHNLHVGKTEMFSSIENHMKDKGVFEKAQLYFINSCKWQRRIRKYCFEATRRCKTMAGFDFLGPIDTHWHTFGYDVGMMNEFYELKPDETVENVLRYNSPTVLLNDLGLKVNFESEENLETSIIVSHYSGSEIKSALLSINLFLNNKIIDKIEFSTGSIKNGSVIPIYKYKCKLPNVSNPAELKLSVSLESEGVYAQNQWELYLFPSLQKECYAYDNLVISEGMSEEELLSNLENGKNVVIFGDRPFNSCETSFRIALAGRTSGNLATVLYDHQILKNLPHNGFCGWQFSGLLNGGRAVCFESDSVIFEPIIEVVSTHKYIIKQSALFEFRALNGKLIVCSFNFKNNDPASRWLRAEIINYALGSGFNPANEISKSELCKLIHNDTLVPEANKNLAFNANDKTML